MDCVYTFNALSVDLDDQVSRHQSSVIHHFYAYLTLFSSNILIAIEPCLVNYLPPAGREIIKHISCVCSCVIECVSRFYKGLYITLVVSP